MATTGRRVRVDGKQFALGGERFPFRGVTYGTFLPRPDGALFPEPAQVKDDFAGIAEAGFTVVRTYTEPPDDVLEAAAASELKLLAGVFHPDWRYSLGHDPRQRRRVGRDMRATVRDAARRLAGVEEILALSVGNEIPADVIRWLGTRRVAASLAALVAEVRDQDPDALVTYGNFPTTEYLPLDALDFLTFNVFLERRDALTRYLNRLHHLAGDRPLVLGELGLHAGADDSGEQRQAGLVDWQLEAALERGVAGTCIFSWTDEWGVGGVPVEGWHFGLTREDRSPRPALEVARGWNQRDLADLRDRWPAISVVVCAYNAAATLDECLGHACELDYPDLEVIVVDDGSSDDTAAVAERHPRARLLRLPHGGLSAARNAGFQAARGELVAYLDSDAYPPREWPYYLALGLDDDLGGVGGPNVPPPDDPPGAHQVAHAPGGPVHVLVSDTRAEHIPGCNMAFRRRVLSEVGGFDPVYEAAGDDVDLCWKVLDAGWEIGFHPAALVWHHRRPGARAYLRQQRGYGRAEALVEARHPDRFTPLGTARWRGRIYDSFVPDVSLQRIYRGRYGAAPFQAIYQGAGHGLDLAHQIGVPVAVPTLLSAPLALVHPLLGIPALAALALLVGLAVLDVAHAHPPHRPSMPALRFRLSVAALHLLQPLVRTWGRLRHGPEARRELPCQQTIPGPVTPQSGGVLLVPATTTRADLVATLLVELRRAGRRVLPVTGWEDHDGTVLGSTLLDAELVTSAHPEGCVQLRARRRLRARRLAALVLVAVGASAVHAVVGAGLLALTVAEAGRGEWLRRSVLSTIRREAREPEPAVPGPGAAPELDPAAGLTR